MLVGRLALRIGRTCQWLALFYAAAAVALLVKSDHPLRHERMLFCLLLGATSFVVFASLASVEQALPKRAVSRLNRTQPGGWRTLCDVFAWFVLPPGLILLWMLYGHLLRLPPFMGSGDRFVIFFAVLGLVLAWRFEANNLLEELPWPGRGVAGFAILLVLFAVWYAEAFFIGMLLWMWRP